MKTIRFVLSLAVLLGLSGAAHAYRVNVLDPNYTVNGFTTQPFSVTFDTCQDGQLPDAVTPGQYCFTGQNQSGHTLTTLEIVLPTTGAFAGKAPICEVTTDSLYNAATCGTSGGNQVFYFSGLDIPSYQDHTVPRSSLLSIFTILIEDLPPGVTPQMIPSGNGGFLSGQPNQTLPIPQNQIVPTVPEPSSILLLSTGILSMAGVRLRRKSA